MNASEKAHELTGKFIPLVNNWDCFLDKPLPMDEIIPSATKCALASVDEIIKVCDVSMLEYWEVVKAFLENEPIDASRYEHPCDRMD
jgi:hypothetical protein